MPTNLSRAACRVASLLAIFTFVLAAATVQAQPSKSSAAAKELGEVLDRLKLDSIAAADPSEKDTFVAALYFQGSTLLVVSAKYSAPALLVAKLTKKDYRDTYIDLNSASVAGTKIFVMDAGADGLVAKPEDSQAPDSWEEGNKTTAFDGDWKKSKMTEDDYLRAFSTADARYTRILAILTETAKKGGS
jgi:hypothetical protein